MGKRSVSKNPRKSVKRLPKLKGGDLIEVTVRSAKKRATEGKKPIPKKELEIAEEDYSME
jgi:hypothetical protein